MEYNENNNIDIKWETDTQAFIQHKGGETEKRKKEKR